MFPVLHKLGGHVSELVLLLGHPEHAHNMQSFLEQVVVGSLDVVSGVLQPLVLALVLVCPVEFELAEALERGDELQDFGRSSDFCVENVQLRPDPCGDVFADFLHELRPRFIGLGQSDGLDPELWELVSDFKN